MGDDGSPALYEAKITTRASELFLQRVMLTFGSQSLDIDLDPFVESVQQNDFNSTIVNFKWNKGTLRGRPHTR